MRTICSSVLAIVVLSFASSCYWDESLYHIYNDDGQLNTCTDGNGNQADIVRLTLIEDGMRVYYECAERDADSQKCLKIRKTECTGEGEASIRRDSKNLTSDADDSEIGDSDYDAEENCTMRIVPDAELTKSEKLYKTSFHNHACPAGYVCGQSDLMLSRSEDLAEDGRFWMECVRAVCLDGTTMRPQNLFDSKAFCGECKACDEDEKCSHGKCVPDVCLSDYPKTCADLGCYSDETSHGVCSEGKFSCLEGFYPAKVKKVNGLNVLRCLSLAEGHAVHYETEEEEVLPVVKELECEEGYDNCNEDFDDGCETDLNTDDDHCGKCTKRCRADLEHHVTYQACENGVCMARYCDNTALYVPEGEICTERKTLSCCGSNGAGECLNCYQVIPGLATGECHFGNSDDKPRCELKKCTDTFVETDDNQCKQKACISEDDPDCRTDLTNRCSSTNKCVCGKLDSPCDVKSICVGEGEAASCVECTAEDLGLCTEKFKAEIQNNYDANSVKCVENKCHYECGDDAFLAGSECKKYSDKACGKDELGNVRVCADNRICHKGDCLECLDDDVSRCGNSSKNTGVAAWTCDAGTCKVQSCSFWYKPNDERTQCKPFYKTCNADKVYVTNENECMDCKDISNKFGISEDKLKNVRIIQYIGDKNEYEIVQCKNGYLPDSKKKQCLTPCKNNKSCYESVKYISYSSYDKLLKCKREDQDDIVKNVRGDGVYRCTCGNSGAWCSPGQKCIVKKDKNDKPLEYQKEDFNKKSAYGGMKSYEKYQYECVDVIPDGYTYPDDVASILAN